MIRSYRLKAAIMATLACSTNQLMAQESIYRYTLDTDKLIVWVTSHGCTHARDLSLEVDQSSNYTALTVTRTKPDRCRRAPMIEPIELQLDTLGLAPSTPVLINNPIVAPEAPLRNP